MDTRLGMRYNRGPILTLTLLSVLVKAFVAREHYFPVHSTPEGSWSYSHPCSYNPSFMNERMKMYIYMAHKKKCSQRQMHTLHGVKYTWCICSAKLQHSLTKHYIDICIYRIKTSYSN